MDERSGWRRLACLAVGGVLCFTFGCRTPESRSNFTDQRGVLHQSGESPLIRTQDDRIEVYYPRPYSSKPDLKLAKMPSSVPIEEIELLEQAPDHFTVRWKGTGGEANLSWHAEGFPGGS